MLVKNLTRVVKQSYQAWKDMNQRCYNPRSQRYKNYGGRGIEVCPQWRSNYLTFINDMGVKSPGYSLDRIDNNKGYMPENCRWATSREQALNRRTNVRVSYQEVTLTIDEWSKKVGVSFSAMKKRFARWEVSKAVNTPVLIQYVRGETHE